MKHGHNRNGKRSPEYRAWGHMKDRCQNPNDKSYHNYGSRGIKVCERWQDFRNFFADMGARPSGLTLERMDNDGNYEPGNCKWASYKEQNNNKRSDPKQFWFVGINPVGGKVFSNNQSIVAKRYGLDNGNISACLAGRLKTHGKWRFEKLSWT